MAPPKPIAFSSLSFYYSTFLSMERSTGSRQDKRLIPDEKTATGRSPTLKNEVVNLETKEASEVMIAPRKTRNI